MTWRRPLEPISKDEAIRSKASEIREALRVPDIRDVISEKQKRAIGSLREWYPQGGKIYVIRRRRTRQHNLIIDCKRIDHATGRPINIGLTVADALDRPYLYAWDGFQCYEYELPDIITGRLSLMVCGDRGLLNMETL